MNVVIVHAQDTFKKNCDAGFFCQSLNTLQTLYIFSDNNISVVVISVLQRKRQKLTKQDKQVNRRTEINKAYGYESL